MQASCAQCSHQPTCLHVCTTPVLTPSPPCTAQVVVPKPYFELTSRRVLTTAWLEGEKLSQSQADDVGSLVNLGVICYLKQLLDTGFFHADPHPGAATGCRLQADMQLRVWGLTAARMVWLAGWLAGWLGHHHTTTPAVCVHYIRRCSGCACLYSPPGSNLPARQRCMLCPALNHPYADLPLPPACPQATSSAHLTAAWQSLTSAS